MSMLKIYGASIFDTTFTLDAPGMPEVVWNISRMEHDAFLGRFGPPQPQRFDALHGYGPDWDKWQHLDRAKVSKFIRLANVACTKPDWASPKDKRVMKLIDIPCIAVILPTQDAGVFNAVPVDGNHRMMAREVMGLPGFHRFVVPPELEGGYRVTMEEST